MFFLCSVRPVNKKTFLQHVEDLCANDNAKFLEEFGVSVCLPEYRNTNMSRDVHTRKLCTIDKSVSGVTWRERLICHSKKGNVSITVKKEGN